MNKYQYKTIYLFTICLVAALGGLLFGYDCVVWIAIVEFFPNRIRGEAMSVSIFYFYVACFVLAYTFFILNSKIRASYIFGINNITTFYILYVPTEGKTKNRREGKRYDKTKCDSCRF